MRRDPPQETELVPQAEAPVDEVHEPPVVARLVVEIRSDGSRTIARGALEDRTTGQTVAIEARGNSPLELAFALARTMWRAPSLVRNAASSLLATGRNRKR